MHYPKRGPTEEDAPRSASGIDPRTDVVEPGVQRGAAEKPSLEHSIDVLRRLHWCSPGEAKERAEAGVAMVV